VTPQRLPNPALVGKSALAVAEKAGIAAPPGTRTLIAPLAGVGRDYPLSIEKLCPVLSWYEVADWREGCERCIQILRYGGMGHTMSIHSRNEEVILEFGLKKPAFRICVNTPTTHGSIGLTTGLDPAMTLGCGGWGGNITSDNITPRHLLNIKRLAYELRPAVSMATGASQSATVPLPGRKLPKTLPAVPSNAISAATLTDRIDAFLASRGYRSPGPDSVRREIPPASPEVDGPRASAPAADVHAAPAEFVCEDDVRSAIRDGRKVVIGEKTIVTPSARDLGESAKVFVEASWPR
jgi:acetaldehyde dehydrogenase (acetylating)